MHNTPNKLLVLWLAYDLFFGHDLPSCVFFSRWVMRGQAGPIQCDTEAPVSHGHPQNPFLPFLTYSSTQQQLCSEIHHTPSQLNINS